MDAELLAETIGPSIYGLYDQDGNLRYIGKAIDPAGRLKGHMRETRRSTPIYSWIRKHGCPELRVLEKDCADWRESERRLIAEARARGEKLLNIADGGDEPFCPEDVRAKNGAATARAIQSDPFRKRVWNLKREVGRAIKNGFCDNTARAKLRRAAELRPDLFGCYASLPDLVVV